MLFTARKRSRQLFAAFFEAWEVGEHLFQLHLDFRAVADHAAEAQVVLYGEEREQVTGLRYLDDAEPIDLVSRQIGDIDPIEYDLAGERGNEPADRVQRS